MKTILSPVVAGITFALVSGLAWADTARIGEIEYVENCAVCHGPDGAGDGPIAEYLVVETMPDLRLLTRDNGGRFPFERVQSIIDGRTEIRLHGPNEMPIWGYEYDAQAPLYGYFEKGEWGKEIFIQGRIYSLVNHLKSLQIK